MGSLLPLLIYSQKSIFKLNLKGVAEKPLLCIDSPFQVYFKNQCRFLRGYVKVFLRGVGQNDICTGRYFL